MKTNRSISLRFLVLLLILVAALPVYPILARRIGAEREELMRTEQARLHMHVTRICANEPIHLDKVFQIVNGFWGSVRDERLGMFLEPQGGNAVDVRGEAHEDQHTSHTSEAYPPAPRHDYASFVVIDSAGRAVLASHDSREIEGQIRPDLVVLAEQSRARGGSMTGVGACPVHRVPAIVVARPAKDDVGNDLPETMLVFLHREWFGTTLNAATLPEDSHILIWDATLKPMIWSDSFDGLQGSSYADDVARLIAEDRHTDNGVVTVWCEESGVERFLALGAIKDSVGNAIAYVSITAPVGPVLQAARARAITTAVEMGLLVGLTIAALWVAAVHLLIRPISELAQTAARFGAGDLQARHTDPPLVRELARLSRAFNAMAISLEMRTGELALSTIRDKHQGVYNGLYLDVLMSELDGENATACAVLCANVDGLRIVNRAHGYDVGNAVLAEAAGVLVEAVGERGYVIRTGGDSFAVVLPGQSAGGLAGLIGSLRERLTAVRFGSVTVSLSVGVATRADGSMSLLSLINKAESNMHKNKFLHVGSPRGSVLHFLRRALAERTHETEAHSNRLQEMMLELGRLMNMSAGDVDDLLLLCMLHDVGKVGIPDSILNKPGPLTPDEWEIMRTHSEIGARIVRDNADLADIAEAILSHHERWDGSGYPRRLAGEDIPLYARMLSVVDAFDAMVSDRPYKSAMRIEEASQEVIRCAGTQFDPVLAKAFHQLVEGYLHAG